jgi:hypothetical protein
LAGLLTAVIMFHPIENRYEAEGLRAIADDEQSIGGEIEVTPT